MKHFFAILLIILLIIDGALYQKTPGWYCLPRWKFWRHMMYGSGFHFYFSWKKWQRRKNQKRENL